MPEAEGFNVGADNFVKCWNTDWKMFFADVCKRTGLSLQEAMQFHLLMSSHVTSQATSHLAEHVQIRQEPKEPWQE